MTDVNSYLEQDLLQLTTSTSCGFVILHSLLLPHSTSPYGSEGKWNKLWWTCHTEGCQIHSTLLPLFQTIQ
jgi:hypothetical protein